MRQCPLRLTGVGYIESVDRVARSNGSLGHATVIAVRQTLPGAAAEWRVPPGYLRQGQTLGRDIAPDLARRAVLSSRRLPRHSDRYACHMAS